MLQKGLVESCSKPNCVDYFMDQSLFIFLANKVWVNNDAFINRVEMSKCPSFFQLNYAHDKRVQSDRKYLASFWLLKFLDFFNVV